MITNEAGRQIIKDAEALRLEAYLCPAGIWTIGYGHTGDVEPGMRITAHQAEAALDADLDRFERGVSELAPSANENEFSAMVSLAFNIGLENFKRSSVLRYHLMGAKDAAAKAFSLWDKAKDPRTKALRQLPGLVKRRKTEAALYLKPLVTA